MKPAREWDEAYALSLPVGEFDWVEIKSRRGLDLTLPAVKEGEVLENMAKAVSAFANSGGGQLVYGLKNPSSSTGKLTVDDGGISTIVKGKTETREWLEDIIPNLVEFPLSLFNVYAILPLAPDSQLTPGRAIYVIDIGDSPHAPHQSTYDNKYYARVGGKSRPLGHRLVADIMNRRQYPQIELEFTIERKFIKGQPQNSYDLYTVKMPGAPRRPSIDVYQYDLTVHARNNGRVFAQYVNCFIDIPIEIVPREDYQKEDLIEEEGKTYVQYQEENTVRDIIAYKGISREYGPSRYEPILPELYHRWTIDLKSNIDLPKVKNLSIKWAAYADNSPPIEGQIQLKEIQVIDAKEPDLDSEDEDDE